jgi:hypothetical protein
MSTTVKNLLSTLADANNLITLGVKLGGTLIPLATGVVKKIEQIGAGTATVTYQVLIQTDSAELDGVIQVADEDLAAINAELAKLGLPAVQPLPPSDPSGSSGGSSST